ncbi:MAG TPA: hypothetical protein VHJ83_05315, partial [Micromonosporaceae bacterium]|nr:hypothetical protein [Micromonosporaceae bacterium]
MPESLEFALTRTLAEAADAAPAPPIDLLPRVDTGFRKRRNRRYSAVAGVAVFAVMLGSAIWISNTFAPQPNPRLNPVFEPAPPAPLPSLQVDKPAPVAEVWPEAHHTIPRKLPDGRKITPQDLINEREVLATTDASFENADALWTVNVESGEVRLLARLPKPHPNHSIFASHFTVSSGHVVWLDSYTEESKSYTRIWKVPVAGGEPVLVTTVPSGFGNISDRLLVHRDTVYLSSAFRGGIWRAPLEGGDAVLIAGTETYQLVSWPWAGTQEDCTSLPAHGVIACQSSSAKEQRIFAELFNLETRARRTVAVPRPDLQAIVCTVNY